MKLSPIIKNTKEKKRKQANFIIWIVCGILIVAGIIKLIKWFKG